MSIKTLFRPSQGSKVLGSFGEFPGQPGEAWGSLLGPWSGWNSPFQSGGFLAIPGPKNTWIHLETVPESPWTHGTIPRLAGQLVKALGPWAGWRRLGRGPGPWAGWKTLMEPGKARGGLLAPPGLAGTTHNTLAPFVAPGHEGSWWHLGSSPENTVLFGKNGSLVKFDIFWAFGIFWHFCSFWHFWQFLQILTVWQFLQILAVLLMLAVFVLESQMDLLPQSPHWPPKMSQVILHIKYGKCSSREWALEGWGLGT